jgi:CubicO group peptidase (beta-lactamase class C family)
MAYADPLGRTFLLILLAVMWTVAFAAPVAGQQWTPTPAAPAALADADRERSTRVDTLFRAWDRHDSLGAAVLVMRNGQVVHARGYGMANLEHGVPIGTGTVFDVASVSKQFAAFAIAVMADEGALDLDDDVRRHIPELPDFGHTIRIRHLVHHTSGLRDWPGTLRIAGWDFMDVVSYQQILAMAFHQRELNFPPGSEHAYSNTGYNLMAEIVARVTDSSFRDWTHERIFQPLGMTRTHFHDDWTEIVSGRAESYRPAGDGSFRRVVSSLTAVGSSSLFTTVEDLARWIRNFDDPVVGNDHVLARMTERGVLTGGDTIAYAFGLGVGDLRGATTLSHGGAWAGYRSTFLLLPEHALAVVVLGNSADVDAGPLGRRIAEIYLDDVLPPPVVATADRPDGPDPAPPEPFLPDLAELAQMAGEYASAELFTSYRLAVEGGQLTVHHFRLGRGVLRPVAPDIFEAAGFGRIEFTRNDSGQVTGFTANSARVRGLRFEKVR